MLRSIAAAAAVAALSLTLVTDALAQGRSRGGFTGGARMGGPSFRAGGPAFHAGGPAFRGNFARPGFVNPGFRVANPGFRRAGHFRRFGFVGVPLVGAYAGYSYYNQCVVPQTVLTPYGYRTRWINVCDDYLY
jgi:hypothetical protein